jgi:hypothetical protein
LVIDDGTSHPESRADIYELVDRDDVAGSSFSFNVFDDDWDFVDGRTRRTLLPGKLLDVGPTSQPAYQETSVTALRSFAWCSTRKPVSYPGFSRGMTTGQPAVVAQHSHDESPMSVRFKQLELMRRKMAMDQDRSAAASGTASPGPA